MSKDCYQISRESLNLLLHYAGNMFDVGTFLVAEHRDRCDDFRSDVLCDGVWWRMDKNYKEIYKLVNIICNDGKIDGEL